MNTDLQSGGIAILFRRRVNKNHFREILLSAPMLAPNGYAIICSGFFQENKVTRGITSAYQASKEGSSNGIDLATTFANNQIKVLTYGVHNKTWLDSYKKFVATLRAANVQIKGYLVGSFHWHAKVFILSDKDNDPILGIIGSSNLTRPAFSTNSPFNHECDVVLWTNRSNDVKELLFGASKDLLAENPFEDVIYSDYDSEKNGGFSIEDRLRKLREEIQSIGYEELE